MDKNNIPARSLKAKPLPADDNIAGEAFLDSSEANLLLQTIRHRGTLFYFILAVSGLMFLVYITAIMALFFWHPTILTQICNASTFVLVPLNLLLIAPVTMVLALLYKLYRRNHKEKYEENSLLPQLDIMDKTFKLFGDMLDRLKDISK